jgi:hypothetical protein
VPGLLAVLKSSSCDRTFFHRAMAEIAHDS